jgi:hypothetical protein
MAGTDGCWLTPIGSWLRGSAPRARCGGTICDPGSDCEPGFVGRRRVGVLGCAGVSYVVEVHPPASAQVEALPIDAARRLAEVFLEDQRIVDVLDVQWLDLGPAPR